ncbi:MAG TPA: peptidoglycan-binding domain-containing protein [Hyphomicrobiales bacterium]|nr:peptidoglycan-binding domain-containing protein [Hyphomicrobiales bacterium]
MPHRREEGRGLRSAAVAVALRRPLDSAAAVLAGALAVGIIVNALALQANVHHRAAAPRQAAEPAPVARPVPRPAAPAVAPLPARETAMPAAEAVPAPARTEAPNQSLITAIQTELKRRGVYRDKVDGELGPKTGAAILSFQVAAGLAPTGQPSEALLRALRGR